MHMRIRTLNIAFVSKLRGAINDLRILPGHFVSIFPSATEETEQRVVSLRVGGMNAAFSKFSENI
jgi:hypothetical protein